MDDDQRRDFDSDLYGDTAVWDMWAAMDQRADAQLAAEAEGEG